MNNKSSNEDLKKEIQSIKNLINLNKLVEAENKIKKLIIKYPSSPELLNMLGVINIIQKKLEDAEIVYLRLIELDKNFAEAYNNLGEIYFKQNKDEKAILNFKKALSISPKLNQANYNLAKIYTNLGNELQTNNSFEEAINNYKKAIEVKMDFVEAHNNLGIALQNLNRLDEAIISFKKAIKIKSDYVESHNNLGNILMKQGKNKDSIESYKEAIKIKPDYVEAHSNLGAALNEIGDFDKSNDHYKYAIEIKPDFEIAYNNLAASLITQGKINDAIKFYKKAFDINPKKTQYQINADLLIPVIPKSKNEIKLWRDKYSSSLNKLRNYDHKINDPQKTINPPGFNLSYSDHNNLEILKKVSNFFRFAAPDINYKTKVKKDNKNHRIKIGFISEFFTDHTIGKLYRGLISAIDKKKFELVIFHFSKTKPGKIKNEIDLYAEKTIILNGKITDQQKIIEKENLKIIFYPDIGMTSSTYFLAHSRLADAQIVGFGHPETSGISTIDYFLSSNLMETKNSNHFYSEKLICLDKIWFNFIPPNNHNTKYSRSDFNFDENENLYCCPQTLFKIHPDFDELLEKIVKKDKNSKIVMIETKHKAYVENLKQRWSKNNPLLNRNVRFVKSMNFEKFLSLIDVSDVLLDPLYFGSGLSFLDSMLVGTPTVTMPNAFMRSNVVSGAYKQMKITNPPIAKSVDQYVNLSFDLANNKKTSFELKKNLRNAAKKYLFNDLNSVKKFEKLLIEINKKNSLLEDEYIIK
jgi:protein O-GlcNAc transferase